MAQKSNDKHVGKGGDSDMDHRSLFSRLIEAVVIFFICVVALKYAIEILISIRVPLILITVSGVIIVILYRLWRYRRDRDDY